MGQCPKGADLSGPDHYLSSCGCAHCRDAEKRCLAMVKEAQARAELRPKPAQGTCPDCGGTKVYVGLNRVEPCRGCQGPTDKTYIELLRERANRLPGLWLGRPRMEVDDGA